MANPEFGLGYGIELEPFSRFDTVWGVTDGRTNRTTVMLRGARSEVSLRYGANRWSEYTTSYYSSVVTMYTFLSIVSDCL